MGRIKIHFAEAAGFCMGVRRAIETAEAEAAGSDAVFTYGELIHNQAALDALKTKGVGVVHDPAEAAGTIVIRAHGITTAERDALCRQAGRVVDATCTMVQHIKDEIDAAHAKGALVLVCGEPEHPEAIGLKDGREDVVVIREPLELRDPELKKRVERAEAVTLVAQSTQLIETFDAVALALAELRPDAAVHNTICGPTRKRQEALLTLAQTLPLIVVVGDAHSANTRHLVELARRHTRAERVSDASELDPEWFTGISEVGVSAGASTPDETIQKVVEGIEGL